MADAAQLAPLWRFDSGEVPEKDRFGVFNEIFGRIVLCDVNPLQSADPVAFTRGGGIVLPDVQLARGESARLFCERAAHHTSERDDVSISISLAGSIGISQRGSDYVVEAGEAYVDLGDVPASATNMGESVRRDISLIMPRRIFASAGVDPDTVLTRPIRRDTTALKLLVSYAESLRSLDQYPSPTLAAAISAHLCDLALLAIGATGDIAQAARPSLRVARLKAIKSDIAKHVGPFPLSLGEVAIRHGISPSYVRKLFERDGTSFSAFILAVRLDRALRMLGGPAHAALTISAIAYECGFSDLSHFNRSFRRRFGCTPGDTRAGAQPLH